MTRTRGCRARPGPVLAVEAFIGEHPGIYRPEELADIFAVTALPPAVVKEVLAHLLGTGRVVLDNDGRLDRRPAQSPRDDPLSGMSDNDHPDGLR